MWEMHGLERGLLVAKPSIIGTPENPLKHHFLHLFFLMLQEEFGIFLEVSFS